MKLVDFFHKFPSAKSTYSNRIFIEEIWFKMFGERGLDYLDNEVAFKDFENKARRIDFVVKTKTGEYAIEVDDFQTHAGASPKKQSEDELKKNSLREKYKDKFITITKYDIEHDRRRAKNTLSRAFIADPDLNRNSGEKIEPHDIQIETLTLLKKTRAEGKNKGLVCYATGLGKTYLSAFDAKEINGKTLFVVHRDEILTKAEESFRRVWPEIEKDTGFFNAEKKETNKKVIFASIQTLYKKNNLELFKPNEFNYIILDETHHAADSNITYKNVLNYFKPKFLLGLTATPERADEFDILKNFYNNNLIIEIDQKQAIDGGYLVPVHCSFLYDNVDYTKIRWNNRKYNEDDLNKFLIIPKRDKLIFEEFKKLSPSPKKTLVFCVNIKHAERMNALFRNSGLNSCAIHSDTSILKKEERKKLTKDYTNNKIDIACVVDIFNEGIDIEQIDCLLVIRPTESPTIAIQQLGRGLRLSKGKSVLRVLNFIGKNQRKAFENYKGIFDDIELDEKGEYYYDNGSKIYFDAKTVDIFKQQEALYSANINLEKIPKDWKDWGQQIEYYSKNKLHNKVGNHSKDIVIQLEALKIIKKNPNIHDSKLKLELKKFNKKNAVSSVDSGVRGLILSKILGLYNSGSRNKVTKVFDLIDSKTNDFKNILKYNYILENQLQKICYFNNNFRENKKPLKKDGEIISIKSYQSYFIINLYKVILEIGKKTGNYYIQHHDWTFFILFSQKYEDCLKIINQIMTLNKEKEYYLIVRYLHKCIRRHLDDRIPEIFYLSNVIDYNESYQRISIKDNKIKYVENIINNFEKKLSKNEIPFPNISNDKYLEMLYSPESIWENI